MSSNKNRASRRARIGVVALGFLVATGCTDITLGGLADVTRAASPRGGTFQANYLKARSALDGGKYRNAVKQYGGLVDSAGPMAARIRIEYAHALLRAGDFQQAANEARLASMELDGLARTSALAVQATALHELALQNMEQGVYDRSVYDTLAQATATFGAIRDQLPTLDPQGGLDRRYAQALQAEGALKLSLGL